LRTAYILLLIFTSLLLFFSCYPDKKIQKGNENPNAEIDSVFFYKQRDVENPLIDAVLDTAETSSVVLKKQLVPEAEPLPDYKLIQGYRVQIFAGLDSINALFTKNKAEQQVSEPVYIVRSGEMVKVQVGDFPYQAPAYKLRDNLAKNGFKGAWVVQREIRVPLSSETEGNPVVPNADGASEADAAVNNRDTAAENNHPVGKFTIQVAAVSDETRAQQLVYELQDKFQMDARYKSAGKIYKVYLGNFPDRASADSALQKVRAQGYPDAWLVY
jgi:cell division septation protein DedD